jgi:mRNA interferase RelE/StbE
LAWSVEWDERAFKELESLDKQAQRNILKYLKKKIQTEEDPRRFGAPLHDDLAGLWKYRIGDYRLICTIEDNKLVILVLKAGHRKNVYKNVISIRSKQ